LRWAKEIARALAVLFPIDMLTLHWISVSVALQLLLIVVLLVSRLAVTSLYPDFIWQDDVLKVPRPRVFRTLPVSMPVPSWCAHSLAMPNQPPT
jgi:hypothetical protein